MTATFGWNYWKLWSASAVSNLGDGIATVAYPWLASSVTRDPIEIALIGVATRLPWFFFALPAGVITDRVDRRQLIAVMDMFRCSLTLVVATIVLFGPALPAPADLASGAAAEPSGKSGYLALLYVSALLFGMAEVLRDNAAQTLMPSIVHANRLEAANGRLWSAEMVMNSFAGPPLAGLLIAVALSLPFFLDAVTFGISAILIFAITGDFRQRALQRTDKAANWFGDASEGVAWLWRHGLLRDLAIILGVMNAMNMMALATYVLFVQEILELSASQFGLLMTAGAVGGVLGGAVASHVSARLGPGPSLLLTVSVSAVQFAATGATSNAAVVWAMFFAGAFVAMLWNVITVSLRQQIIPDELLGRVNSVYRFFGWGMMPVGTLLGGVIVAVTESVATRELALRMPFFFAAGVYLVLVVFVVSRLTTGKIEDARAAATDQGRINL